MSLETAKELDQTYVMHTFGRSDVEFVSGHGMTLVDSEGVEYTDFLAGIGVCSLGHCHPVLVKAVQDQAARLVHVSNYFHIEHRGEVARRLSELADSCCEGAEARGWKTFFSNSGAESNECAMKLARLWEKRNGGSRNTIVALRRGFHGRTLETVAATMQDWLQDDFRPLPGGFVATDAEDIDGLEALLADEELGVVAVLLEPIQGESGVHPLSAEYMRAVRELTEKHHALMICDEVQCGLFRSGKPFAFQLSGITPDIFTLAKGIAGGVPMGACLARPEIADTFRPGDHGSTFGGSNLACAAADAVLGELAEGQLDGMGYLEHVSEVGEYLKQQLGQISQVEDVRGAGLMVGCDLVDAPDAHEVVRRALMEEHLVLNATGDHTLRFLPPLVCQREHVDTLVSGLSRILG